jgi:hypothetical protein
LGKIAYSVLPGVAEMGKIASSRLFLSLPVDLWVKEAVTVCHNSADGQRYSTGVIQFPCCDYNWMKYERDNGCISIKSDLASSPFLPDVKEPVLCLKMCVNVGEEMRK